MTAFRRLLRLLPAHSQGGHCTFSKKSARGLCSVLFRWRDVRKRLSLRYCAAPLESLYRSPNALDSATCRRNPARVRACSPPSPSANTHRGLQVYARGQQVIAAADTHRARCKSRHPRCLDHRRRSHNRSPLAGSVSPKRRHDQGIAAPGAIR